MGDNYPGTLTGKTPRKPQLRKIIIFQIFKPWYRVTFYRDPDRVYFIIDIQNSVSAFEFKPVLSRGVIVFKKVSSHQNRSPLLPIIAAGFILSGSFNINKVRFGEIRLFIPSAPVNSRTEIGLEGCLCMS